MTKKVLHFFNPGRFKAIKLVLEHCLNNQPLVGPDRLLVSDLIDEVSLEIECQTRQDQIVAPAPIFIVRWRYTGAPQSHWRIGNTPEEVKKFKKQLEEVGTLAAFTVYTAEESE